MFAQERLLPGNVVDGPAIIEAEDTTVVIEPGWTFRLGEYLDGILQLTGDAPVIPGPPTGTSGT